MNRWVALLRGVNVNGITVRSADLAQLFRDLGFGAVRTVLASGNVRFETADGDAARAELKTRIEAGLSERFGYEAWIVLIPHDDLAGIRSQRIRSITPMWCSPRRTRHARSSWTAHPPTASAPVSR